MTKFDFREWARGELYAAKRARYNGWKDSLRLQIAAEYMVEWFLSK